MNLHNPLTILRISVDSEQIKPIIPPFVKVISSITGKFLAQNLDINNGIRD